MAGRPVRGDLMADGISGRICLPGYGGRYRQAGWTYPSMDRNRLIQYNKTGCIKRQQGSSEGDGPGGAGLSKKM